MKTGLQLSVWLAFFCLTQASDGRQAELSERDPSARLLLLEQEHFINCLTFAFNPEHWISYNGSLYFKPWQPSVLDQIERLKSERAAYLVFTNAEERHEFSARLLAESKIQAAWQTNLLLSWSVTNQDLLPTLYKPMRVMESYKLLQEMGEGDALLRYGDEIIFVMNYGHGAGDPFRTNACLIKEGMRTYRTVAGNSKTVEAFTCVNLRQDQVDLLRRLQAFLRRKSSGMAEELIRLRQRDEFETHRVRAMQSEPSIEYLLALDYLQGRGTDKDEVLGLQWMHRAAQDGSGDAESYLASMKSKSTAK